MSTGLARYLKDFGDPQPPQPVITDFDADNFTAPDLGAFGDFAETLAPDPDAIRQEAYAEGYETASVELGARHQDTLDAMRQLHAEEIENLTRTLEEEAATRIAAGLRQIAAVLAERISDEVAHCLAPVLQEEVAAKAVADMADLVRLSILEGEAGPIIVKGPLPLFNILAIEMGEDASVLRHVEAADLDLSVEIAGSVLVTRMSAFAASLKKVLE